MAIAQGVTDSFLQELGIHQTGDTYKGALYTSSATLGKTTTVYSSTNEVTGPGYSAGGATLSGFAISFDSGKIIYDFSDVSWPSSTITARGMLIYNSSRSNKSVMVIDFGADKVSTAGTFAVVFPAPAAATGLIRLNNS